MKQKKAEYKRPCPAPYPQGSWMGNHHFVFRPGTNVEMGGDAGYFCAYCGKELEK